MKMTLAQWRTLQKPTRNKYGNVKKTVGDKTFHSTKEASRYTELCFLVQAGKIEKLATQVKFSLDVNGVHIANYIADFTYIDCVTGLQITEDVKGYRDRVYLLKQKLMRACYGIEILET